MDLTKTPVTGAAPRERVAGDTRLYSMSGIMWATFIGNLAATGLLMSHNYRAVGQPEKARAALWLSLLAIGVLLLLALVLPESVPAAVFVAPQLAVAYHYARQHQLAEVLPHVGAGGTLHSNWRAAGIGLLVTLGTVLALLPVALLMA